METEQKKPQLAAIPLLVFAAIDLLLAFSLLLDDGFTLQFGLIALIGLALAGVGLRAVRRGRPAPE